MDGLAINEDQKIVKTTVRLCEKSDAKKLLKQWLDFHLIRRLKLWIDWLLPKALTLLKQRFDFPIEKGWKKWID